MSRNKQRKRRSIKRLKHRRHHRKLSQNIPLNFITESRFNRHFDYPLPELFADHSTDPMQNTSRQYIVSDTLNEGRFMNHEMIIRKNGESTIHRPKDDNVLVNGFAPIIRPSDSSLSYQCVALHSQIASSTSIINKMSRAKSEQTITNNKKRKANSKKQKVNNHSNLTIKEALHDANKENNCVQQKRVPLRNLSAKLLNNNQNQSMIQELEDICFNRKTISKQQ